MCIRDRTYHEHKAFFKDNRSAAAVQNMSAVGFADETLDAAETAKVKLENAREESKRSDVYVEDIPIRPWDTGRKEKGTEEDIKRNVEENKDVFDLHMNKDNSDIVSIAIAAKGKADIRQRSRNKTVSKEAPTHNFAVPQTSKFRETLDNIFSRNSTRIQKVETGTHRVTVRDELESQPVLKITSKNFRALVLVLHNNKPIARSRVHRTLPLHRCHTH
eukprot:TRINITY_DN8183_c0_g1_i3.p1 TRINITY_DN8183_c0_g1~~TRINITY_DN8183_c0_g1_i3.p1  ORF type:complete len:218 (+),score=30.88 TRINITY_DN8183_c0_g1_i3:76-729(+)